MLVSVRIMSPAGPQPVDSALGGGDGVASAALVRRFRFIVLRTQEMPAGVKQ